MRESNSSGNKPIEEVEAQRLRKAKFERVRSVSKCKKPELPLATVGTTEEKARRKTGIDILGEVRWGTHFCVFYQSKQDLIDILVPYFKAGLENNEFCMWITSEPLSAEDAEKSLSQAVTNLGDYIKKGQIEILDYSDWYTKSGVFEADRVLRGWVQKHDQAIKNGFDGLRVTGNTFWLEKKDWIKFTNYEAVVNGVIGKYKMLAICTYSLDKCGASEILDVENNHQFSLIKWRGDWKILESSSKNQLEARLAEQTAIAKALERSKKDWVKTFNAISDWVVLVDLKGRILRTNRAGENFTGKTLDEIIGQSCCKLVHGEDKPFTGCPLRTMLHSRQRAAMELNVPNTNRWLMVTVDPVVDGKGNLVGAVHITRDITQRKKDEKALRESEERYKYLFEQSPLGIGLSTPDGRVVCGNKAMEVITGYFEEELKKINLADTYENPADRKKLLETIERYGCAVDFPTRLKRKDGTVFDVLLNVSQVHLGGQDLIQTICMDITERKRAEEALQESEDRYRDLFEAANDIVLAVGANGQIIDINRRAEELTGFTKQELLQKNVLQDLIVQEDKGKIQQVIQNLMKGLGQIYEVRWQTKDGRILRFEGSSSARLTKEGKFVCTRCILRDISERKKAQEELRRSEKQASAAIEAARGFTFNYDIATGKVKWGGAIEAITGYTPEEFAQVDIDGWTKMIHPNDRDRVLSILQKAIDELDRATAEYRFRTKNGGYVTLSSISLTEKKDGKAVRLVGILQDITERKKAEDTLRKSEEKFKNIFEHANDSVIYLDNSGKILDVNEKAVQMFGGSKPGALNKHFTEIGVFPADDIPMLMSNFEGILAGKDAILTIPIKNKKGQEIILECSASLMKTDVESGNIMFIASYITERKKAEEQIEKLARFPAENPNPVLRISARGTVIYGNEASLPLLKVWRCRVGRSVSGRWYEFVLDALSSGQSQQTEVQWDGKTFSLTFAPVIDSNYVNVYGLDITDRKKAEEEAREGRDYLEKLTNSMWDAVFSVKMPDRVIEWVNDSFGLSGYEPGDCIGRTTEFLYPDKKEFIDFGNKLKEAIKAGDDLLHAEQLLKRKNGETFPAEITTTLFREKGEITRVTSIVRDITKRKRSEEKLLEYQKQLKSLASQLTLTEEQERRRIATELHDNITQSLAMSKLKLDLVRDSNSSSSADLVEVLNETSRNIEHIIQEVRTLTFDLSSPILYELGFEAAVAEWLTERIEKEHYIAAEFEDDGQPKLLDDDTRTVLFRDVRELLTNVVKHAQAKKVKVSIRKDHSRIHVIVEDDGRGFDPKKAAATAAKAGEFGLFSIRERLKQLGGNIEIESAAGHGTRVTLAAPLKHEG